MQFITAISLFATLVAANGKAGYNSAGVPTSCGQNTCCIPACNVSWQDDKGCNGRASFGGSCSNMYYSQQEKNDHTTDICGGARITACGYNGHKLLFVVNGANELSAHVMPQHYDECTLSGQCKPCGVQGSCTDQAYYVGTVSPGQRSCEALTGHWATFVARAGGDRAYKGC
ncbi:hypothetical protein VHEMI05364 [[Torrubiella] hemipterigena]|uniref:Uncharacterized protein n=1 Tax=[Torrubiella] hemipterigena TaxID=1531966 RepID=A0A0A1TGT5_9HYPO|nr:hypothetical protein VHEMI05364 [[Torrubiella] hemipterigena]